MQALSNNELPSCNRKGAIKLFPIGGRETTKDTLTEVLREIAAVAERDAELYLGQL